MSAGQPEPSSPSEAIAGSRKLDLSAWSWATYQAGRDPYIGLVNGFLFAPYFATTVVGDGVKGHGWMMVEGIAANVPSAVRDISKTMDAA